MDVEVVHYQVDGFGFRVCECQGDGNLSELKARAVRRGEDEMTASFRLYGAENISCAAAFVFVIASCFPPRIGWRSGPDIAAWDVTIERALETALLGNGGQLCESLVESKG